MTATPLNAAAQGAGWRRMVGRGGRLDLRVAGFWLPLLSVCAASGAFFGALTPDGRPALGAVYGLCCGGAVMAFEQGVLAPGLRKWLRALPWLVGVMLTEFGYLVMILAGSAVAGLVLMALGVRFRSLGDAVLVSPLTILYALVVSGTVITMTRMRDLIGAEMFRNILFGRYYKPVEEERIFLFIDLIGSTAYAQTHGDLRAQAFLGAIFAALAEPVRRHGGFIDDYVGDMALVTWPLRAGVREGRCVACVFAFLDAIAAEAEVWLRRFGQVPQFRAALHGGGVVTAEVGVDRHKISYFGDVVNTTGRIEALCRTLNAALLISADLYDRLAVLPEGVAGRPLGAHALRGRGQLLSVLALERVAETAAAA